MSFSTQEVQGISGTGATKSDGGERRFYRFYSVDIGGRIVLAEDHECADERAALALGRNILAQRNCPKVEVWLGKVRIGISERPWTA